MVHHTLLQGLIRHAWGASLTNVGLRVSSLKEVKIPKTTLRDEDKSLRALLPKEDNELVRGKNPYSSHCVIIFYLRSLSSLSKQIVLYVQLLSLDFFFLKIILTKIYISLCANFSFSFDSLIWNTNGFVSI